MSLRGEIVVVDGSGRLVAMLFGGQDAAIRTDVVLPSPGWSRTLTLSSAENVRVERGEVSTWQGRIPMDATHKLEFRQTVRERDGRVVVGLDYTALNDLTAEGLFFRINIPWVDFRGGTAGNGTRTIQLPETAPANNNLLYGETAQLDARSASGGMWWAARFNRPFGVNLQDKSSESPKSYTFWVYLQRGNMGAGTRGSVEVELALDGIPDTTTAGLRVEPETPRYVFH
ncbi:MAG: hypothetical protein HZB13_19635, partial [Acidobacteria bacterium]|nr:hypothetical protein [Acidobacteriota bacterium]